MPKETFFNLPEEKRTHITNIAIEEFANYDYGHVSISRIVARAGIAKGSFYQYFEDKEDLLAYLLDLSVQKKWELYSLDHPDPQHLGVFRYLIWTAQAGMQYQLAYPALFKMATRVLRQNALPPRFLERTQQESQKFFAHLVATGKEQGDIASELDDGLAAFVFNSILTHLGVYIASRLAENEEFAQGKIEIFETPELKRLFEQAIHILEFGMGNREPLQPGGKEELEKEVLELEGTNERI